MDTYLISRCAVMGETQSYGGKAAREAFAEYANWTTEQIEKNG